MKNLTIFATSTAYENATLELPNVSLIEDGMEVRYAPIIDYSKQYLTFVAKEAGTISFNILRSMGTDKIESISYSTDNGNTWRTTANQNNKSQNIVIGVNVNTGDTILWKGTVVQTGFYYQGEPLGSFFSSTANFDAQGNVMSLLYGDDFKGKVDLTGNDNAFCMLFNENTKIVSAKNLSLPATTLAEDCYNSMFKGCTALTKAPELPATTLASSCYYRMFQGCTALTAAPVLPATTLAEECYYEMFNGCTSLTAAPELPATTLVYCCYMSMFSDCTALTAAPVLPSTTLATGCYQYMFYRCTSLTAAPVLSATTLAGSCYSDMFNGCTALATAPELPATTLAYCCYQTMFNGCTALATAPELPATTLADYCYNGMFSDCTSLTTAPELPATTLASQCYGDMFKGCTKLNYIKAMFTTVPSATYTYNWVYGVSTKGTFVKNSAAAWNVTGVNGIPTGWTVQTATL